MASKTCRTAAVLLAVGIGLISGCSSTSSSSSQTGTAAKPAVLNFWGWANGQDKVVAAFNASHKNVQIKYTLVNSATYLQQLSDAVKAGNAPCLVQSTAENLTTLVSQSEVKDLTQYVAPHQSEFNAGAYAGANVGGKVYGVPTSSAPSFTIYRTDVFAKYGLTPPTTWDQFISDGEVLKAHGVYITNYAGEDPSTLEVMAMQAGAHWYTIDGNSWKVDFQDAGTLKAAAVIQKIIDEGLDSQLSFADYAAVQQNYDKGGTVTRQISTWQMAGMVKNFTKSDGDWALSPWPEFTGEGAKTPAGTNQSGGLTLVSSDCSDTADAAAFALWLSTDTSAVDAMASPTTGNALMPALNNTASLVGGTISQKLLGTNYQAAESVVVNSLSTVTTDWTFGPDWTAMYSELADGWAKVMTKQQTLTQLLAHMQQWTVADLKSRGINVEG